MTTATDNDAHPPAVIPPRERSSTKKKRKQRVEAVKGCRPGSGCHCDKHYPRCIQLNHLPQSIHPAYEVFVLWNVNIIKDEMDGKWSDDYTCSGMCEREINRWLMAINYHPVYEKFRLPCDPPTYVLAPIEKKLREIGETLEIMKRGLEKWEKKIKKKQKDSTVAKSEKKEEKKKKKKKEKKEGKKKRKEKGEAEGRNERKA